MSVKFEVSNLWRSSYLSTVAQIRCNTDFNDIINREAFSTKSCLRKNPKFFKENLTFELNVNPSFSDVSFPLKKYDKKISLLLINTFDSLKKQSAGVILQTVPP